jgi:hypothetical protein
MNHMPAARRFQAGDAPAVAAIIGGLPDYFTDDVPAKVERDTASHEAWVITDSGTVAGFAVAARKSPAGAEILWIAIDAAARLPPRLLTRKRKFPRKRLVRRFTSRLRGNALTCRGSGTCP